jgi:hypothetical protein
VTVEMGLFTDRGTVFNAFALVKNQLDFDVVTLLPLSTCVVCMFDNIIFPIDPYWGI